jgi:hypothetical protein
MNILENHMNAMYVEKLYNAVAVEFTNINAQCIANWPSSRRNNSGFYP